MILRLLVALVAAIASGLVALTPAAAADCGQTGTSVSAAASGNAFTVDGQSASNCAGSGVAVDTVSLPPGQWVYQTACAEAGAETCSGEPALCDDGSVMQTLWYQTADGEELWLNDNCPEDAAPAPTGPTIADIRAAFRAIPMQPSVLQIQPPGGQTLVNFRTNFFTVNEPFERSVPLLGAQVDFRIRAATFTWHFGDGTTRSTSKPGAPYPKLDITHSYGRKGQVAARVDTTYTADYRVNGGPWAPVNDTVTIPGAPVELTIREARPVLVG